MKKLLFIITILILGLTSETLKAQSGWSLQTNPISPDTTSLLGKVQFVSPTEGWISVSHGQLLHTTDAGAIWNIVVPFPNDTVESLSDPAITMTWVGQTHGWKMNFIGDYENPRGAVIYKTIDGGIDWTKKILSTADGNMGIQIQFVDGNNGWASVLNDSTGMQLFRSTDGGNIWNPITFNGVFGIFYFVDANNGWSITRYAPDNLSTPEWSITHTTDGGVNWSVQYTDIGNTNTDFTAIQFTDLNNGWVVGDSAKILKTTDGGTNWTPITNTGIISESNSKSVFFLDANKGWISSKNDNGYALIQHTTDGGRSWVTQGTPIENTKEDNAIFSIYFYDAQNGWLTADNGIICHYTISGNGETVLDYDENIYNTVTIGTQTWMTENLRTTHYNNGDAIATTDPDTLDISLENSPKYQWASYGNENIVPSYGRLYTWYVATDSRGICPTGWHIPSDAEWTTLGTFLTDNGYGYEGNGNDIAKSMASKSVWATCDTAGRVGNDQSSNNSSGFFAFPAGVRFFEGYYYGFEDATYWWSTTQNSNGMVWSRNLDCNIAYLDTLTNYYLNNGFSIRCINDSTISEVDFGTVNQTPQNFSLSQNYPNPFNPVTTISYQLPKSNFVQLSIYNITGQLIETLVNGHNNAGYHTVLWNASEVGSGLYFYRIEAGEYTETKKCLILK